MVDPFERSGSNEPGAGPSPEGHVGMPPASGPAKPLAFDDMSALPSTPRPVEESRHPVFPVVLGAGFALALVLACTTNPQPVSASGTTAAAPAPAPATPPASASEPSEDAKGLKADIDKLSERVKALQDRVEASPKVDLAPLQAKIDGLAKSSEEAAELPRKVEALDGRVGGLEKSLAALHADVAALKDEIKKGGTHPSSSTSPRPDTATPEPNKVEDVDVADEAFSQGADLFKAGKYKEASDIFRKVTETSPNDARAWYFAALSNGLATNQWKGETEKLVNKGVERERAGTPEAAKINALFANLPPQSKAWLDYYRKTAQR